MLHIVNHARHLHDLLCLVAEGDTVLLVQDAVYAVLQEHPEHHLLKSDGFACYALTEDIKARGLNVENPEYIQLVGFDGFVDLTAAHQQSLSWG